MSLVKSENIYSPQNFILGMTGECFILKQENTVAEIEAILDDYGFEPGEFWNYPLSEIDAVIESGQPVVLVDCSGFDENGNWKQEYRWWQVDEEFPRTDEDDDPYWKTVITESTLVSGWKWVEYDDHSGHIENVESEESLFSFDASLGNGVIWYSIYPQGESSQFVGTMEEFRIFAEKEIIKILNKE